MVKFTTLLLASVAILACSTSAQVPTESHSNSVADIERFNPVDALGQIEAAQLSEEEGSVHILPFPTPNNKRTLLRRAERTQPKKQKKTSIKAVKPSPKLTKEQQLILNAHNKLRARHQAPPLVWNDKAAKHGRDWIQRCRKPQHSNLAGKNLGENLAWGTKGMFKNFGSVVQAWYDEEKDYNYSNPDLSRGVTGHFTQVVWRGTKSVGCAMRFCPNLNYEVYICNYAGAGNMGGEYARNVRRRK
ncbi:hypothetical protein BGZ70_007192 [Mortierella alpina]|uniref:SCP domain-containing protein n=1 Tax=Mortierella alpina TaxID=64518 RepID=A0A9P6J8U5_MORAP|nr:hypothetical protein BGZ70_007192 [Mortierella alpina]